MVCACADTLRLARSAVALPSSARNCSARSGAMNEAARLATGSGAAGTKVAVASDTAVAMRTTSASRG
jgi:hypothetical protein